MSRRNLGAARSAAERALFALNASDVGSALAALDEAAALLRPPAPVAPVEALVPNAEKAVAIADAILAAIDAPKPEPAPAPKPPAKKARR